jgi:hypothetical protein
MGHHISSRQSVGLLDPQLAVQSKDVSVLVMWIILIILNSLWLKTEQDCYVTEFDTLPYWRRCMLSGISLYNLN